MRTPEDGDWIKYNVGHAIHEFGVVTDAHPIPHIVRTEAGLYIRIEDIVEIRRRPVTGEDVDIGVETFLGAYGKTLDGEECTVVRDCLKAFALWFIKRIQHE